LVILAIDAAKCLGVKGLGSSRLGGQWIFDRAH
jgi:hypothetical protein